MKKNTKTILTVAAVIVGGLLLWKTLQPIRLYPAIQKREYYKVF